MVDRNHDYNSDNNDDRNYDDNSDNHNRQAVPSFTLSIGSWSFSVSGPTVWNALPDYLTNPTLSIDVFKRYLKTFLFAQY